MSLGRSSRFRRIFGILLFVLAIFPLMIQMFSLSYRLFHSLAVVDRLELGMAFGLSAFAQMVFVFSILYVWSIYFHAQDIEYLLPLPFKPGEILGAKFLATLLYEYVTAFVLLAPLFLAFAFVIKPDFLYAIYAGIVFFMAPVIPLSYASLFVFLLFRFFPLSKKRDQWGKWSGIFSILLVLGLNFFFQTLSARERMGQLSQWILHVSHGTWISFSQYAFGSLLASRSLVHPHSLHAFFSLLEFCLCSVLALVVFLFMGNQFYFQWLSPLRGIAGAKEKKLVLAELKNAPVWKTYWRKEMRILFRDPGFFVHCIVMGFIWPIFFLPAFFFGGSQGMSLSFQDIRHFAHTPFFYLVPLVLGMVLSASNAIASTFLSREGKQILMMKYLPIPFSTQILAKAASAFFVSFLAGSFWFSLFILLVFPPWMSIWGGWILLALGAGFSVMSGMALDLLFPKFTVENPYKAVRQNLNVYLHLIGNVVLAVLIGSGIAGAHLSHSSCFWILFLLFLVFNFSFYGFLVSRGRRLFSQLIL